MSRRLAVVGCGRFARFALTALAGVDGLTLDVISSRNPENAAAARQAWRDAGGRGEPRYVADAAEAVRDPSVHIVYVAVPPDLQPGLAVAAVAAGKDVFVEKPGALVGADLRTLAARVAERGVRAGVNLVLRHHPLYQLMVEVVRSGVFGPVEHVDVVNDAGGDLPRDHWFWNPARSGGIWVEHAVHFLDLVHRLAGFPRSVTSVALSPVRPGEVPDRVAGVFEHGDGDHTVISRHLHAFTHDPSLQRCGVSVTLAHGYARTEGWIPWRLVLEGQVTARGLQALEGLSRRLLPAGNDAAGEARLSIQLRAARGPAIYRGTPSAGLEVAGPFHFVRLTADLPDVTTAYRAAIRASFLAVLD
ncbi:MAG: Gfo/Idh/MocA family oxidoreductase, partial [Clostridia bacterium]|nr:Gfo/Idh/MocA family oxidoreductase [Clostridia bacterium]